MSGHRKRRWEKFGDYERKSSSSSDEESTLRLNRDKSSHHSIFSITKETSQLQTTSSDITGPKLLDHLLIGNTLNQNIGPALPPNFVSQQKADEIIGPSFPPHLLAQQKATADEIIGPSLPPHLLAQQKATADEIIGPSLPPHLLAQQKATADEIIGPSLPPHLLAQQKATADEIIGPSLPPHLLAQQNATADEIIGPSLPPHLLAQQKATTDEITGPSLPPHLIAQQNSATNVTLGPSLPPHLLAQQATDTKIMGPALPHYLLELLQPTLTDGIEEFPENADIKDRIMGPQLPPQFAMENNLEESSDDDVGIGPDPRLMADADTPVDYNVAERAERARKKMLGLDKLKQERESWMLELPPERAANLGLGARQFRGKLAPEMGDRTVWTDTPSDKAKKKGLPAKVDEKEEGRKQIIAERDRNMEKMARKAEKKLKRKESLLESHSKKMEKEAEEKAKNTKNEPQLRKMFSREDDMQVHKFDEAQKKAIFKKAQFLNDRFSQGESKYL